jgi:hypothetical protein
MSGIPKTEVASAPPALPASPQKYSNNENVDSTIVTMKCFGAHGLTEECSEQGYICTRDGLAHSGVGSLVSKCHEACQCVDVNGSPPETDDLAGQQLSRREDEPGLGPWEVWCGDIDSMHDPQMTDVCIFAWKYQCDSQGNLNSASKTEACSVSCACIRQQQAHRKLRGLNGWNSDDTNDAGQLGTRDSSNEADDPPRDITYDSPFSGGPWGSFTNDASAPGGLDDIADDKEAHDSGIVGRSPTTLVKRAKDAAQTN